MPLDGADLSGELRCDGRGIARTGADLENPVAFADFGSFQHQGDDIGLRDGLAFGDRKRVVLIGEFLKSLLHESFARDAPHRRQHTLIANSSSGDLNLDHVVPSVSNVGCHGRTPSAAVEASEGKLIGRLLVPARSNRIASAWRYSSCPKRHRAALTNCD